MTKIELEEMFFTNLEELKWELERNKASYTLNRELKITDDFLETCLTDTANLVSVIDEIDDINKTYIKTLCNGLIDMSHQYKKHNELY